MILPLVSNGDGELDRLTTNRPLNFKQLIANRKIKQTILIIVNKLIKQATCTRSHDSMASKNIWESWQIYNHIGLHMHQC